MLLRQRMVRTGIDLGTGSVKLIRGDGTPRLERITEVGFEDWDSDGPNDVVCAAGALKRLLTRLGIKKNSLGRIAVAAGSEDTSIRETEMIPLSLEELEKSLPFEAKKHLTLDDMSSPMVDFQILQKPYPVQGGEGKRMRVLFAAAPAAQRDFPLKVLSELGMEPEVVDLEPLAGLNALFAKHSPGQPDKGALALVDLGGRYAVLHMSRGQEGFLSRSLGPGTPPDDSEESITHYADGIVERLRETIRFYRGRHRNDVDHIYLGGGGALLNGLVDRIQKAMDRPVSVLNPLDGIAESAQGLDTVASQEARFVTAAGLCRWWDEPNV